MKDNHKKKVLIWTLTIVVIIAIAYTVSTYFYQLMLIQGNSMNPTYKNFSMVIIDKRKREFHSDDIIAFTTENVKGTLVKRIVGEPGDRLKIKDGTLYVNDNIFQTYEGRKFIYSGKLEEEIVLGEDEYFVIGDNIDESKDSRYQEIGIVLKDNIKGKIVR